MSTFASLQAGSVPSYLLAGRAFEGNPWAGFAVARRDRLHRICTRHGPLLHTRERVCRSDTQGRKGKPR
jgi:hypothetical protein